MKIYNSGLYESKEVLKLRMERMKSYRQQRRLRRGISVKSYLNDHTQMQLRYLLQGRFVKA